MNVTKSIQYRAKKHLFGLYKKIHYGGNFIFDVIDIETTSICNRRCPNCPVSKGGRETGFMTESLFYKVIDELSAMNFIGSIRPHFYGEPLIDKRLVHFVEHARDKCPRADITVKSNGDLLTLEKLCELIAAGVSRVLVTQYDGYFTDNIKNIYYSLDEREREILVVRILTNYFENRADQNIAKISEKADGAGCEFPGNTMFVTWDGKAVLCGADYYGRVVLGDVNIERIIDIWNSDKYRRIRSLLDEGRRNEIDLCKKCNHYPGIASTAEVHYLR